MIRPDGFAYVEPASSPTAPAVDYLTRRAAALLRSCKLSESAYRGIHGCTGARCIACSDNRDHYLPDGRITHSLLVHYVACHRIDVSPADLEYLAGLDVEAEPTNEELHGKAGLL